MNIDYIEQYVELDLPYCGLTFGQGDCDGNQHPSYISRGVGFECFNCKSSCMASTNVFENNIVTKTIRFVKNTLHYQLDAIPILQDINISGQKIFPGQQLSARERASFTLGNIAGEDQWLDKNIITSDVRAIRGYTTPFLGKFHARYPDLKGIPCRYTTIEHYEDGSTQQKIYHYIVESVVYNGSTMVIDALDILSLLDDDQQTFPTPFVSDVTGEPLLIKIDISKDATLPFTFDLPFYTLLPADGFGNTNEVDQYLQSYEVPGVGVGENVGEIVIGSEILAYTRTSNILPTTQPPGAPIGFVTISCHKRGLYESKISDIKINSTVNTVGRIGYGTYTPGLEHTGPQTAGQIFAYLASRAGVPELLIKPDRWLNELTIDNASFYIKRTIAKPIGLKTLTNQLIADVNLEVFIDETASSYITLRPLSRFAGAYNDLPYIDQTQIEKHSVEIDYDKRFSTLLTYYGNINPLEQDKESNYYGQLFYTDTVLERTRQHQKNVLKKRFNNWMNPQLYAELIGRSRVVVSQYNNIIKRIKFTVPSTANIKIGGGYRIYVPEFTNVYGEDGITNDGYFTTGGPYKIIEVKKNGNKLDVVAEYFNPDGPPQPNIRYVTIPAVTGIGDARLYGVNLRAAYDAVHGATPPVPEIQVVFQMENPSWWISNPLLSEQFSVVSGDWPANISITLDRLKIYGRAGRGYSEYHSAVGNNYGGDGGSGLQTSVPLILKDCIIKGAGGGAGCNRYDASTPFGKMAVWQNGGWGLGGWYKNGNVPILLDIPINADQNPYYRVPTTNLPPNYFQYPYGGMWGMKGDDAYPHAEWYIPGDPGTPDQLGGDGGLAIDGMSMCSLIGTNVIEGSTIN